MLLSLRNLFRPRRKPSAERSFTAAAPGRMVSDWIVSPLSADAAMRGKLTALRSRARDLERNNEWARGFLRTLENNVIGENGVSVQLRVKEANGKFDEIANDKIETAWWQWGKVGRCTVCRRHSWIDTQRIILRAIFRDGEILVRYVRGRDGLCLQLLEADLLDENANYIAANGNEVRFGVELDANRGVVAYHLLGRHPGDQSFGANANTATTRIDAADVLHLFFSERPDQTRGYPPLCASMQRLKMLDGYAEAELVAARTGAAKMGFFTKKTPDGWTGEIDDDGNLAMDASPGTIEELPPGVDFKEWPNDHPNSGYGDYVKSTLRGVASSLGISYNSLASDLEGVNYSSIRAGLLEEREVWKAIQRFFIQHVCEPIFSEWLTLELLSGRLGLPYEKMWKFDVPEFQGRRWPWVDPKKDMEAAILARRAGLSSIRKTIAEGGGDIYDVFQSIAADDAMAASMGIQLPELTDAKAGALKAEIDTVQ